MTDMACSLNHGFSVSGSNETNLCCGQKRSVSSSPSVSRIKFSDSAKKEFIGKPLEVLGHKGFKNWNVRASGRKPPVQAQGSICISRALRWWEKIQVPNMIEIQSARELVDTLLNAGDKLVIIDFYSPGCGGCRALHPKICQLAEANPNAVFLKVNHDELKSMCQCLHVHVLPFFRFYRGAEGKLCSFSCTNATIKKFKDALAKYGTDGYGVGPAKAKGLDEKDLAALASAGLVISTGAKHDLEFKSKGFDLLSGAVSKDKDVKIAGVKERTALVMA